MQPSVRINSPKVVYSAEHILSEYTYHATSVTKQADGSVVVVPTTKSYSFQTETVVPKLGVLLVGWGGNNGSTVTAGVVANRHKLHWETRTGTQQANYLGSVTQASTINLGPDAATGLDVFVPLSAVVPMVHPNDFVIGGWDISGMDLARAMRRAQVLEPDLIRQVEGEMKHMVPMPSIYYPDFIAANQSSRADNLIPGDDKQKHLEHIRADIRNFKKNNKLDKVVVCWTANTER